MPSPVKSNCDAHDTIANAQYGAVWSMGHTQQVVGVEGCIKIHDYTPESSSQNWSEEEQKRVLLPVWDESWCQDNRHNLAPFAATDLIGIDLTPLIG
ncbi:hypothetical protein TNCV_306651 [Trichonephila clavipes]|nr:hypothetical protein TNCV_306651 [Trichonephila clavipes]